MGWLLHLVQRGGAWVGCGPAQSPPRCTKCNSHPSTASVPTSYHSTWHYNCLCTTRDCGKSGRPIARMVKSWKWNAGLNCRSVTFCFPLRVPSYDTPVLELVFAARPMSSRGVRPSVCLTRSCILSKGVNISLKFFHRRAATPF